MENLYVREAMPKIGCGIPVKEKADKVGFENLCDGELLMLATNLPEEKVKDILEKHPLSKLATLDYEDLVDLISRFKARQLVAALELAKRVFEKGLGVLPIISCPADTISLLTEIKDKSKEYFLCLYLNARNQVIHKEVISIGSLSASIVHPREVLFPAINYSAASIILSHNHPSGDVSPSEEDIELTRRLTKAGEIMGIEILDHLVISPTDFLSMKEQELL